METLDIILILALLPFLIRGLTKGLITQVFAIISIFFGAWLSVRFSTIICEWLHPYLNVSAQMLNVASFTLIMVVTILLMNLLGKILQGLFKLVMLGWIDRLLGLVFSMMCAVLTIGLGILIFEALNNNLNIVKPDVLAKSVLYTHFKEMACDIFPYIQELLIK